MKNFFDDWLEEICIAAVVVAAVLSWIYYGYLTWGM